MTLIRPPSIVQPLDRAFALEAVRVTEAAAIAAAAQIGRGDEHAADQAAVEAMRAAFNALPISGTVVRSRLARPRPDRFARCKNTHDRFRWCW